MMTAVNLNLQTGSQPLQPSWDQLLAIRQAEISGLQSYSYKLCQLL